MECSQFFLDPITELANAGRDYVTLDYNYNLIDIEYNKPSCIYAYMYIIFIFYYCALFGVNYQLNTSHVCMDGGGGGGSINYYKVSPVHGYVIKTIGA